MEDVLRLTTEQIKSLVDYVIAECSGENKPADQPSSSSDSGETLDKRMSLLLRCCIHKPEMTAALVNHLYSKLKDPRFEVVLFVKTSNNFFDQVHVERKEKKQRKVKDTI